MEHLDADLAFPSSDIETLDFTTEDGGVSTSCLLQILPSEASYPQGGLDLHEYAATLSPGISLTSLGETVMCAEAAVTETFESSDPLPSSLNVCPSDSKAAQVIGDSGHLLDGPLFAGIQSVEVESSNIDGEDQSINLDTQVCVSTLTSIDEGSLLSPQPPSFLVEKQSSSARESIGDAITPPVNIPPFTYFSESTSSLSSVAPNVFLTSAHQKTKVNHFPNKKPNKSQQKNFVKHLAHQAKHEQNSLQVASAQPFELSAIDARQIRVELTQVSNDTTIVKLSLIPEATINLSSENVFLNHDVFSSSISDTTNQTFHVNTMAISAESVSDITIDHSDDIQEPEDCYDEDDEPLVKLKGEIALKDQVASHHSNQLATEDSPINGEAIQNVHESTDDVMCNDDDDDESQKEPCHQRQGQDSSFDTLEVSEQNLPGSVSLITATSSNWNAMEDMTLENAEAEMASLLAESKLRMKTLAKLDEITIHINDSHCKLVGGKKRWCCDLCSKSYTTKNNLVVHTLGHNGIKPHVCMVCQRMFSQQSHLKTHMLTHGNIRPHACKICHRTFTQLSHVKRHMSTHMDAWPHHCDICQRGFAYPSELKAHSEKHKRAKDHKCTQCDATFDQLKKLQFHMRTLHKNPDELTCNECGKQYMYPSQLREHLIKHSGKRPYECEQCGMNFMKEHHLKAHMFTHSGVKPWECHLCQRTFNQKANMLRHMLIHSVEKNFECEICHKHFSQLQTLKAHKVVHSKKKPFQCQLCDKQFGRLHTLQGHMHIHEDSKPHVCFCGATFTLRGNLTRHQKVKHGIINPAHSTEEEAAKILKAMSTKRAIGSQDTASPGEEQTLSQSNTTTCETKSDDARPANHLAPEESLYASKVESVKQPSTNNWTVQDVASTAPLVASFHTYCVKTKASYEDESSKIDDT